MNTEYNKPMEWSDISDLINSASDYLHFLRTYGFVNNASINEIVNRLHNAIDHFDIKMIGSVLGRFNVNQSTIIEDVECKLHIVDDLTKEIGNNMPIIMKEIDPKVSNVFQFLSELSSKLTFEKIFLGVRRKSDPTIGDERANKKLQLFIDGQYGEMSFSIFMSRYVLNDIPTHVLGDADYYVINPTAYYAKKRRLEYLIANCNDDVIKEQLYCYLERCKKEIANYDDEPTPEPQLSPTSGNADDVTHPDTSTPDFSHMESYSPNIQFDLSALYEFLIGESVIKDIDEKLFGDCISHAYMNEVWKVGNHHKLKCVFRHLKDHFSNDWIDIVAQRMNTTRKIITAIDRSKIKAFEFKLTDIL